MRTICRGQPRICQQDHLGCLARWVGLAVTDFRQV